MEQSNNLQKIKTTKSNWKFLNNLFKNNLQKNNYKKLNIKK